MTIHIAESINEIRACYPVIRELRLHLDEETFVAQVLRQMARHGYCLVCIQDDQEQVASVAGFRVAEYLAWGKVFYLDDLVTREASRSCGHGGMLLDWLIEQARALGCAQFHLDSGVQRHDAHRLYLGRKLRITSHHFALDLGSQ
ncbi:MAG: GNAT family N-acetyltransferase [Methylobacillus sp.]|jgi:GNAT superfamily N-acetyltransferase|nr:GNAT family N-acetyltransferase [Methylobacillus sp.]